MLSVITTTMKNETSWDRDLSTVEFYLNITENKTTKTSPFRAVYGYSVVFQDGVLAALIQGEEAYTSLANIQADIREIISQKQEKSHYDRHNF